MHIPPNWGTFFALIVSFLVFWFIFSRIFFRPFLNLLSARERGFKNLAERTRQLIEEAQAAERERERRLAKVRRAALECRIAERRAAENEVARMLEKAKTEARAALEHASARVEEEVRAAELELETLGRSLAGELAERVLGRPLGVEAGN